MSQDSVTRGRTRYLGASEAGAALGFSNYRTPYELWRVKAGIDGPAPKTGPMRRGNAMEAEILAMAMMKHRDSGITDSQRQFLHPDYPWLRARVDGIITLQNGDKWVIEATAPGDHMLRMHRETGLPTDYVTQGLICAALARMEGVDVKGTMFAVLDYEGWEVETFTVDHDEEMFENMLPHLLKFWQHVEDKKPYEFNEIPEVPAVSGDLVSINSERAEELAFALIQANAAKKAAEEQKKNAVNGIIELAGEEATIVHLNDMVRMNRPVVRPKPKIDAERLMRWAVGVVEAYQSGDKENLDTMLNQEDVRAWFTTASKPYRRASFSGIGDFKGAV